MAPLDPPPALWRGVVIGLGLSIICWAALGGLVILAIEQARH
jgi:hypothetical protein